VTETSSDIAEAMSGVIDELIQRVERLAVTGQRRILGITGAPGAGKSTISAALLAALGDRAQLVPMDGFHLANIELERLGRRDRKGAPDTFDVVGYVNLLSRLRSQTREVIYAPVFDRSREEAIAGAIAVAPDVPLVITEGNYLLLDDGPWRGVASMLDAAWYADVSPQERRRRLIERRRSHGHDAESARAWVDQVDEANARIVETTAARASLVVTLTADAGRPGPAFHTAHEGAPS
jgi:pantothenate kinase